MRLRNAAAAVCCLVALSLAACSSDGDANRSASSGPSTGAAATLVTDLRSGLATLTSAHFVLTGTVAGQPVSGSGDQRISNGQLSGLQANASLPTVGSVALVVDGDKRYVKVPPPLATAAKPWLRVASDSDSDNVILKQLAGALDAALSAANLGGLSELAKAATSVRRIGSDPVGGVPATRYALVVDPTKLPGKLSDPAVLGTTKIPAGLWLDSRGRPLQVSATVSVAGQPAKVRVNFSDFDKPVTIAVPPASQVASG